MKHYIMIDVKPPCELLLLDRWYITYHAPETLARTGRAQTRYVSYRTYAMSGELARRFNVMRGRLTEIRFPSLEVLRAGFTEEARARVKVTPPPRGLVGCVETAPVTMREAPDEVFKDRPTPPKETPYFRWIMFLRYPAGVTEAEGEAWLTGSFAREIAALPEVKRLQGHHGVRESNPYQRILELWFDDRAAWERAFVADAPKVTAPAWAGRHPPHGFPYVDMISSFIGENPDIDFMTDTRVIP